MSHVDPEDDSVWRCLVQHYRYDDNRRQWLAVTIDAYDDVRQADAARADAESRLDAAKAAGQADPRERIIGAWHHPGYLNARRRGRFIRRATEHGVSTTAIRRLAESGPLPHNTGVFGWDDGPFSLGGGEPPQPPWDAES